jgi:hypothetical protein
MAYGTLYEIAVKLLLAVVVVVIVLAFISVMRGCHDRLIHQVRPWLVKA